MTVNKDLKRLLFFTIGGAILFVAPVISTNYEILLLSALVGSMIGLFIGLIESVIRNWRTCSIVTQVIFIFLLGWFTISLLISCVSSLFNIVPIVEELIRNLLLAIFIVIFMIIKKLWPKIGLNLPNKWIDKKLLLFPACYAFVNINIIFNKMDHPLNSILFIALLCLLIGFFEEVFFRGILLEVFKKYSILNRVFLSSIIFGFAHLGGLSLYNIQQVVYATFIGIGFAAVRLRTRTITPLILIHTMINFTAALVNYDILVNVNYTQSINLPSAFLSVIVFLPLALYGLFILRKKIRVKLESDLAV